MDLPPGKYAYGESVPGRPASTSMLTIAGDTWELTVGRFGEPWPPLQLLSPAPHRAAPALPVEPGRFVPRLLV
jgi:hypothetical protein